MDISQEEKAEKIYTKALEAYVGAGRDKNITIAKNLLQSAADLGLTKAINLLGDFYLKKVFPSNDFKEAIELYERGCELGDIRSPFLLARCYEKGKGVKRNINKALEYYEKSYDLGNASACFQIARIYERGDGLEQNISKAIFWYRNGAEMNDSECTCNLAFCYYSGKGVTKDFDKAKELFLTHSDYNSEIQKNLGIIFYKGTPTCKPDNIQAKYWFSKSAENGNVSSMINLGRIYREEDNRSTAMEWYKKAAELDNKKGAYYYAFFLYKFEEYNNKDSFNWMKISAENKYPAAEFMLGLFYKCGVGIKVDHTKALFWFNIAAEDNYEQAYSHIGRYYLRGLHVNQDIDNARYWFEKAILSINDNVKGEALYDYGVMYLEGLGVEKNEKTRQKGIDFLKKSKELDCINAINKLKEFDTQVLQSNHNNASTIIVSGNIEEYVKMTIEDGHVSKNWVPNVLGKLQLYIELAKKYNLVKQVKDDGKPQWQLSNKEFAQWIIDVSDELHLYITTEKKQRKYYPSFFSRLFLNKKGKAFKPDDVRHNMSDINSGKSKDVKNIKKLIDFQNKVRNEIKIRNL